MLMVLLRLTWLVMAPPGLKFRPPNLADPQQKVPIPWSFHRTGHSISVQQSSYLNFN